MIALTQVNNAALAVCSICVSVVPTRPTPRWRTEGIYTYCPQHGPIDRVPVYCEECGVGSNDDTSVARWDPYPSHPRAYIICDSCLQKARAHGVN